MEGPKERSRRRARWLCALPWSSCVAPPLVGSARLSGAVRSSEETSPTFDHPAAFGAVVPVGCSATGTDLPTESPTYLGATAHADRSSYGALSAGPSRSRSGRSLLADAPPNTSEHHDHRETSNERPDRACAHRGLSSWCQRRVHRPFEMVRRDSKMPAGTRSPTLPEQYTARAGLALRRFGTRAHGNEPMTITRSRQLSEPDSAL